jgi:hypothetical protein
VKHVAGEFQEPQTVADFPVDLETEDREDQHRQQAEQKGQNDLASNLKGSFLYNFFSSWGIDRRTIIFHHNKNLAGIKAEKCAAWTPEGGVWDQKEKAGAPSRPWPLPGLGRTMN